ncbi:E3 ubiquitin-protein ligase Kcmf1-like isoform X1 [Lutzomyia longipalpis]|uniref:E3 ubiquitin-protein ligase Kcmf1-like isoform X1 n=1 Tax=Lutzomyia longipalpis TaxID=7200 RepID=UPI002483808A|nr:E3 ubiquitin-protein ligase Kcmf1-like isoform X1 [Lutzomyia longipalpis]
MGIDFSTDIPRVSCDSCLKSNFRGRRYKCLICFDYDLCANCYEENATSTRHSADHPMQCILTRSDFELYYGGEVLSPEQPQSFTCPYCKRMGLSDVALVEHVGAEHTDTGLEVVCPVCAAIPGGDPNLVTDDFAGHLTLEHRTGPRDLIAFLDEPSAIRHGGVRRIPHSGRALNGPRPRRSNMHFNSSGGLSAMSPSGRDNVDPIAELLSQLSGVRRAPQTSQLHQLQMQIQLERQQVSAARAHLERLPRRQAHPVISSSSTTSSNGLTSSGVGVSASSSQQPPTQAGITVSTLNGRDAPLATASQLLTSSTGSGAGAAQSAGQSQFLLARFMTPTLEEAEQVNLERERADRSQFVQALMLSTLANLEAFTVPEEQTPAVVVAEETREESPQEEKKSDVRGEDSVTTTTTEQSMPPTRGGGVLSTKPKTAKSVPASLSAAGRGRATAAGKSREMKTSSTSVSSKEVTPDSTR